MESRIFGVSKEDFYEIEIRKKRMAASFKEWKMQLSEPKIPGMAYGFPNRVDRTNALGNAVVPKVAQFIAQRIKEILKRKGSLV